MSSFFCLWCFFNMFVSNVLLGRFRWRSRRRRLRHKCWSVNMLFTNHSITNKMHFSIIFCVFIYSYKQILLLFCQYMQFYKLILKPYVRIHTLRKKTKKKNCFYLKILCVFTSPDKHFHRMFFFFFHRRNCCWCAQCCSCWCPGNSDCPDSSVKVRELFLSLKMKPHQ